MLRATRVGTVGFVLLLTLSSLSLGGPHAPLAGVAPAPVRLSAPAAELAQPGGAWPTYLHDVERTGANPAERTLAPTNASELAIAWKVATNGSDFGSPTIVNGTVYAGSWDGYEYALNASTGHILWKADLGTDPYCSWGNPMGVAGNAAVWNGSVLVGGGNDYWYALNATDGSTEWKVKVSDITAGYYNWASPLLIGGYEYIGVASCIDSPLVQGRLLMVNLTGNHSVVHQFDFVPTGQLGATVWTTPAYDPATGEVWVATGNDDGSTAQHLAESIVALAANNLSLVGHWQVPGVSGQDSDFGSGPTLFEDSTGRALVGATNKNGNFYALNRSNVSLASSWKPVWHLATGGGFSPAAFGGGDLFLAGGAVSAPGYYPASVRAVDPRNGSTLWTAGANGTIYGGLAYANGLVFAGASSQLLVLDASSGAVVATITVPGSTRGQVIEGAPSVAQGRVFFETGNDGTAGYLVAAGIPFGLTGNASRTALAGIPVGFTATPAGGMTPYAFSWEFGDGSGSAARTPSHAFPTAGAYNVSLTVSDAAGSSAALNWTVSVTEPVAPTASISASATTGSVPWNVVLTGNASGGAGPPYTYNWSFGDGTPNATSASVAHEYVSAGIYEVALTVRDALGVSGAAALELVAASHFTVGISDNVSRGPAPLTVAFAAQPSGGLAPFTFAWSSGTGGATATGPTATFTYPSVGNFTVRLDATDGEGYFGSATATVEVFAPPSPLAGGILVDATAQDCAAGGWDVNLSAVASGGAPPYTYAWSFGDLSPTAAGSNVTHLYTSSGTYSVQLAVTDAGGGTNTTGLPITVAPLSCPPRTTVPPSTTAGHGTGIAWWEIGAAAAVAVTVVGVGVWWWGRRSRPRR